MSHVTGQKSGVIEFVEFFGYMTVNRLFLFSLFDPLYSFGKGPGKSMLVLKTKCQHSHSE